MTHRVTEGHASVIFLQSNREQFKLFRTPGTQTELDLLFFTSVIFSNGPGGVMGRDMCLALVGHVWLRTMRGMRDGDVAVITRTGSEGRLGAESTMLASVTFSNRSSQDVNMKH